MMLNKRTVRTQKRRVLRIIGLIILGMGLLAFLYRNQLLNLARNVKQNLSGVGTECRLSGFTLVDAQTGQELLDLADRSTIYLDELPTHPFRSGPNVVSPVARVVFRLDGPLKHTQTETQPPYGVFGSEGTGYHHKPFELGAYTLEAQAFRLGYACSSFKIHFRIQDKRP